MFEEIKKKIGHFLLRRKYLRKLVEQSSFNSIISDSRDIFFVMPKDDKDFFHSFDIIRYYSIHKKTITLFLPEHKYNSLPEKEKFKFISFMPAQITRFNLPDNNLVGRLKQKEFDIVIDLNRESDLFYSAVSNIVNSKVRVGFAKELSDGYYTLQIMEKQADPEVSYRNFLSYLKMF